MLYPLPRRCPSHAPYSNHAAAGTANGHAGFARERAAARKQRPNAKATMNALSGRSTKKSISDSPACQQLLSPRSPQRSGRLAGRPRPNGHNWPIVSISEPSAAGSRTATDRLVFAAWNHPGARTGRGRSFPRRNARLPPPAASAARTGRIHPGARCGRPPPRRGARAPRGRSGRAGPGAPSPRRALPAGRPGEPRPARRWRHGPGGSAGPRRRRA